MFFGAFDADGAFVDEAEVFDVPLLFNELAYFGEAGVVEDGEGAGFFCGLVVNGDVNVVGLHGWGKVYNN